MTKFAILAVNDNPSGLHGYLCIERLPGEPDSDLPLRTKDLCVLTRVWDTEESAQSVAYHLGVRWSQIYSGQRYVVVPVEYEFHIISISEAFV